MIAPTARSVEAVGSAASGAASTSGPAGGGRREQHGRSTSGQHTVGAVEVQHHHPPRWMPEVVHLRDRLLSAVAALRQVHGRTQPVEFVRNGALVGVADARAPRRDPQRLERERARRRDRGEVSIGLDQHFAVDPRGCRVLHRRRILPAARRNAAPHGSRHTSGTPCGAAAGTASSAAGVARSAAGTREFGGGHRGLVGGRRRPSGTNTPTVRRSARPTSTRRVNTMRERNVCRASGSPAVAGAGSAEVTVAGAAASSSR